MKKTLLERLTEYTKEFTPFHMPGHKRSFKNSQIPYNIDITEVEGFDNLHHMQGCLKDTANLARELYLSKESFPLVNGSTCGILAGLYSLTRENKNVLIARNCHKSVFNGVEVLGLNTTYVMPQKADFDIFGRVSASQIEREIKGSDIGTVVVTSPTYEGVISDLEAIYSVCKKYGTRLLVDGAHGAHLPEKVGNCDISVVSLHKTLPSLTQTAVLNVYSNDVDIDLLRHGLAIFETSSPSYILLAAIDECLRYALENKQDFVKLNENLEMFYKDAKALKNIAVKHYDDLGKILIFAEDGQALAKSFRKRKIEAEMVSEQYVLLMATVCDTEQSLKVLSAALREIDGEMSAPKGEGVEFSLPQKDMEIGMAVGRSGEFCHLDECVGATSLEYIWAYPPGVPIVCPGEVISCDVSKYLKEKKDLKSTKEKFPEIYIQKKGRESKNG